jgi:hypothetical protein
MSNPNPKSTSDCPFDPEPLIGLPLGMFHCEYCGEMVLAGMAHPDYSLIEPPPNNRLHLTAFGEHLRGSLTQFRYNLIAWLAKIGGK